MVIIFQNCKYFLQYLPKETYFSSKIFKKKSFDERKLMILLIYEKNHEVCFKTIFKIIEVFFLKYQAILL